MEGVHERSHLSQKINSWLVVVAVAVVLLGVAERGLSQEEPRVTGTYTDMSFNEEGGDVLGEEIKVVYTSSGFQGALQFAEGVPEALIVVDVNVTGNRISFVILSASSYAGEFNGTVENGVLKGEFRFKTGVSEKVSLKRGKSYWD